MGQKKKINSRQKGKRIEREAVNFLKSLGFEDAKRTAQNRAAPDAPDVECPQSLPNLWIEVKGDESVRLGTKAWRDALLDANRNCAEGQSAVLLWRNIRTAWRLSFDWDFLADVTVVGDDEIREVLKSLNCDDVL